MVKKIKNIVRFLLFVIEIFVKYPKFIKYIFQCRKNPFDIEVPWVNFETKEWLDRWVNKEMVIFEYGSGGSTFYFLKKAKKIVSVEHDKSWYQKVVAKLNNQKIKNFEFYCLPPEDVLDGDNKLYLSSDENYKNKSFKKYAEKINEYPDNFFDLIIVDGRARNGCMINVLPKIKNNGYVLLDNSERKEYAPGIQLMEKFEVKKFFGPGFYGNTPWESRIWKIVK